MSLCQSIDTLSMAFLDDELAAEERRELELHLLDCAACKEHVAAERAELTSLRAALVAPPASDLFKARLAKALDAEDAQVARTERRRWSAYVLPGSAMLAAAAAIAVFVGVNGSGGGASVGPVADEGVRQHTRAMPLEVRGKGTGPWLDVNFPGGPPPPTFSQPGIDLIGARLTAVQGHDAAMLSYLVDEGTARYKLSAIIIRNVRQEDLGGGEELEVGDRTMHLVEVGGLSAVTFLAPDHTGYVFTSDRLTAKELVNLVVSSDLIGRAQRGG